MHLILYQMLDGGNRCGIRMPDRRNDFVRRPAAAERLIERHETVTCQSNDFGTLLFQSELLPLGVKNVEEVGETAVVALARHFGRLARRIDGDIEAAQA